MTERAALKLALEALEKSHTCPLLPDDCAEAITAIKEALMSVPDGAQPNPWEKFCDSNCVWTDHHPDCKLAQPEQEPVAVGEPVGWHSKQYGFVYMALQPHQFKVGSTLYLKDGTPAWRIESSCSMTALLSMSSLPHGTVFYTTPPQRKWVGLTPQERDEINEQVYGAVPHHVAFHHAIEARLKEKNT